MWQQRQQLWVCRREDPAIHGPTIMSWSRPSVGVVLKVLSGESEGDPHRTHLKGTWCWEQLRSHTQKITITHNCSLKTVGRGALYLPILAQQSTMPLIATLLLVHISFCASCHVLLRHAKGIPQVSFICFEKQWSKSLCNLVTFSHNLNFDFIHLSHRPVIL